VPAKTEALVTEEVPERPEIELTGPTAERVKSSMTAGPLPTTFIKVKYEGLSSFVATHSPLPPVAMVKELLPVCEMPVPEQDHETQLYPVGPFSVRL
jgi:hypothetical protein